MNALDKDLQFDNPIIRKRAYDKRLAEEAENKTGCLDLSHLNLDVLLDDKIFTFTWLEELTLGKPSELWCDHQNKWEKQEQDDNQKKYPNRFKKVPERLNELPNLKRLIVAGSQIDQLQSINTLTELEYLDLSNNRIQSISSTEDGNAPINLISLKKLRYLNLSNTHIHEMKTLAGNHQLVALNLCNNFIKTIPTFNHLSHLVYLNLNHNHINDFSKINFFPNLQSLQISHNRIFQIPSFKYPQQLKLRLLNLSDNPLKKLAGIAQFNTLESLVLDNNPVQETVSEIQHLTNLTSLSLGNTQLQSSHVSFLKKLTQLSHLNLSDNQLEKITFLKKLKQLKTLNLNKTSIRSIQPISELKQLEYLFLQGNRIIKVSFLEGLDNLKNLQISDNEITDITPFKNLIHLNTLNLRQNNIIDFSPLEQLYKQDCSIEILRQKTSIKFPPASIYEHGKKYITAYFKSLDSSKNYLKKIKFHIIGEARTGKTTLFKRLLWNKVEKEEPITYGINTADRLIEELPWFKMEPKINKIRAYFWDFGGQDIMHNIHQFFLTKQSIFILVVNKESENRIDYWLNFIKYLGGESPTIIVFNQFSDVDFFSQGVLFKDYPFIISKSPITASLHDLADTFYQLKKYILNILENPFSYAQLPFNSTWQIHKEKLLQKIRKQKRLLKSELKEFCRQEKIEEFEKTIILTILTDLGLVLDNRNDLIEMEEDDDNQFNEDFLISDPNWVAYGAYKIINSKLVKKQKGVFCKHQLDEILNKEPIEYNNLISFKSFIYEEADIKALEQLMLKFHLIGRLYDNDKKFYVPEKLPMRESFSNSWKENHPYLVTLSYPYLPPFIFSRFMLSQNVYEDDLEIIGNNYYYIDGSGFDATAHIYLRKEENKIYLFINGKDPKNRRNFIKYLVESKSDPDDKSGFAEIHDKLFLRGDTSVKKEMRLSNYRSILIDLDKLKQEEETNQKKAFHVPELERYLHIKEDIWGTASKSINSSEEKDDVIIRTINRIEEKIDNIAAVQKIVQAHLKTLNDDSYTKILKLVEHIENEPIQEKKNQKMIDLKEFLMESGIALGQNIAASVLFDVLKVVVF